MSTSEVMRFAVVLVITVGATFLTYVGRIDAPTVQAIYLTMVGYLFGFAHGIVTNGPSGKGG